MLRDSRSTIVALNALGPPTLIENSSLRTDENSLGKKFISSHLLWISCTRSVRFAQWAKSPKILVWRSASLLIRHTKYNVMLSKIHSYWLLFRRFCPLFRDLKQALLFRKLISQKINLIFSQIIISPIETKIDQNISSKLQ